MVDSAGCKGETVMPWEETEDFIRSGHGSKDCDRMRTKTISAERGIKAIICFKGDSSSVQSFLFAKAKGWTMSKAKAWFRSHQETLKVTLREDMIHPDFQIILNNFLRFYGDEGLAVYLDFVEKYKLNPAKPYVTQVQLMRECLGGICESFSWAKPLIQYLRKDNDSKYYMVRAITANMSMNKNDYTDTVELERSARTLTGVPLNINHDHSRELPHPANRVEWAEFEDNAVEAIIRIHNNQREIQWGIENGSILNPSIEGDPRGGYKTTEGRFVPKWYEFTALALLEKDFALPGDPVTFGFEPLLITESMGRSLVESLSMGDKPMEKEETMTEKIQHEDTGLKDATPLREGMANAFIDQCGQCNFFKEQLPTVKVEPKVIASEPSDGHIITVEGGVGPGVGICGLTERLVRKNDAACYDGRPRDMPTSTKRDERISEHDQKPNILPSTDKDTKMEKEESIEEMVLRTEINDLKAELLLTKQDVTKEITGHVETQKEVTALQDKLTRKEKELTIVTLTKQRLSAEVPVLQEKLARLKDSNTRYEVQINGLERDVTLYKSEAHRFEEQLDTIKRTLAELKEETLKIRATLNDEVAKRATAVARALSAEDTTARTMKENADLNEQLTKTHRDLTDGLQARSDSAKMVLKQHSEITALKGNQQEETDKLVKEIRDLKQKLGKFEKLRKIVIKT